MRVYYIECSEGEWEDNVTYIVDDVVYKNKEDAEKRLKELNDSIDPVELKKSMPMNLEEYLEWRDKFSDYTYSLDKDLEWCGDTYYVEFSKFSNIDIKILETMEEISGKLEQIEYEVPFYQLKTLVLI